MCILDRKFDISLCIDKCRVVTALTSQPLNIYLSDAHLRFEREPFTFANQSAVSINQCISTVNNVLCTLAETATAIHITCHCACTLLCQKRFQILMFTCQFIACRQIKNQISTRENKLIARWCRCPHVFANLNTEYGTVARAEQLRIRRNHNLRTGITYYRCTQIL